VRQVAHDYREAELDPRQRAMLDWAVLGTLRPEACCADDLNSLRGHGFDDRDLLDLAQIVAYFSYANRLASMLGVALEEPEDTPFRWKESLRGELLSWCNQR